MSGCSGGGGTRRQGTGHSTASQSSGKTRAAGAEAGHGKGGLRQGTWALLVSWATEGSPEAQEPTMTNFATLAKFLPELNPSAGKIK